MYDTGFNPIYIFCIIALATTICHIPHCIINFHFVDNSCITFIVEHLRYFSTDYIASQHFLLNFDISTRPFWFLKLKLTYNFTCLFVLSEKKKIQKAQVFISANAGIVWDVAILFWLVLINQRITNGVFWYQKNITTLLFLIRKL